MYVAGGGGTRSVYSAVSDAYYERFRYEPTEGYARRGKRV